MKLLLVDEDGAIAQEYGGVTAQVDGMDIEAETLKVVIPGEGDAARLLNDSPAETGDFRVRPLLGQSVCAAHVPGYAKGRQVPSDAPCVVCGEPSVMALPKIMPDDKLRSDGEWPK